MNYNHEGELDEIIKRLNLANISERFKGKHILITGGAGFLGSWMCETFLKLGSKVICLDNLSSGQWKNVSHLEENSNFKFLRHDISRQIYFGKNVPNVESYPNITDRLDYVLHFASRASPFEFDLHPIQILKSNTLGTMNALGIAVEHNSTFFYTSTSEVYGDPPIEKVPTEEEYCGNVSTIGPRGCYDESKRAGEAFCKAYEREHGLNVFFPRIFNTYGPRIRAGKKFGRVIPNFIRQCLNNEPITIFGDGKQTRSFTYVVDEIEGFFKLFTTPKAMGVPINIGNETMITVLELAEIIKNLTNSESEISFKDLPKDDPKYRKPKLDRARSIINWEPKTNVETGLIKTIEWFKENE